MLPEFDTIQVRPTRPRPIARPDAPAAPRPAAQLFEVLKQIPPLLAALLQRNPVTNVAAPVIHNAHNINVESPTIQVAPSPAPNVNVTIPPRPLRRIEVRVTKDENGESVYNFTEFAVENPQP